MTKYQLMFIAYKPDHLTVIAKVLIKEFNSLQELEKLNEQMLIERQWPHSRQSDEVKFVKSVQDLIERRHGPRCGFALERLIVM